MCYLTLIFKAYISFVFWFKTLDFLSIDILILPSGRWLLQGVQWPQSRACSCCGPPGWRLTQRRAPSWSACGQVHQDPGLRRSGHPECKYFHLSNISINLKRWKRELPKINFEKWKLSKLELWNLGFPLESMILYSWNESFL